MTRKRKILLFCLLPIASFLAALVILGLVGIMQKPAYELGSRTVAILSSADRVQTFRLDDSRLIDEGKPNKGISGDEIADYPLKFQGRTLGPQFATKLSQTLTDPRTFIGPNDVTCEINPGVAFRAWHRRECVEVIVCFHCQQMLITTKDAQGHEVHSAYTEITWMRGDFLALAREAFPNDKEIQSLK